MPQLVGREDSIASDNLINFLCKLKTPGDLPFKSAYEIALQDCANVEQTIEWNRLTESYSLDWLLCRSGGLQRNREWESRLQLISA
jgi:hypothetical protein